MLTIVKRGKYDNDDGVLYILMLTDFRPQEPIFKKFIESYRGVTGKEGHIYITERTKVYSRSKDEKKKLTTIPVSDLTLVMKPIGGGDYPRVEFWVTPYKKIDAGIEAIKIVLVQ